LKFLTEHAVILGLIGIAVVLALVVWL